MREVSVIEVNLAAIDHNMALLREMIGGDGACSICPIIKADAYGLGAPRIAQRLNHSGAELLAVYTPDQAAELFRAAVAARVLILMPVREIARADDLYRGLVADRLQLTVHDEEHAREVAQMADRFGVKIRVHLEIDTGMSRGGCSLQQAAGVLQQIASAPRLELAGLFTHFAGAESDAEFTDEQMRRFDGVLSECVAFIPKNCAIHAANTFAALRSRKYHRSMVRVGLAWAGYGWEWMGDATLLPHANRLRPAMSWKSRIVHIKTIDRGMPVGYGSTWTAKRRSVIGLVPVGYADGYPIGLGTRKERDRSSKASSAAHGAMVGIIDGNSQQVCGHAPVVGAVNMDQITIDLTECVAAAKREGNSIAVNTQVELIAADAAAPNHLPTLARLAGVIPHELLCRLNPRIKRNYFAAAAAPERTASALAGVG